MGSVGNCFFKPLDVLQTLYGSLCINGCPMGEDGTTVPWEEDGSRAQREG